MTSFGVMPVEVTTGSGTRVPSLQSYKQKTIPVTESQSSDLEKPLRGTTDTKPKTISPASSQQDSPETSDAIHLAQTRQNLSSFHSADSSFRLHCEIHILAIPVADESQILADPESAKLRLPSRPRFRWPEETGILVHCGSELLPKQPRFRSQLAENQSLTWETYQCGKN